MSARTTLAAFAATLTALFGAGAVAGGAIGPRDESPAARADAAHEPDGAHGDASARSRSRDAGEPAAHPVRGLAVAENGLRLVVENPELRRGRHERVPFRVVDSRGEVVCDFDVEHEKRMHFIVARRDLTGFQHLHPEQEPDGSWVVAMRLETAGSYRLFADFSHEEEAYTLASDLRVDGSAALEPLPRPAPTAVSDGGYEVTLDAGQARPGRVASLRFTISRNGRIVRAEPYLGAGGHLVALREGDLAFLHIHPVEGRGASGPVGFEATFPTEGRYRLILQFKHDGRVRTVAFTRVLRSS